MSTRLPAVAPLLIALAMPACGGAPPRGNDAPRARHVVEIRDMAFHPSELEVAAGDTVEWINRDIVPHTATAAGTGGWDTGHLTRGESALMVPWSSGRVSYVCTLHPTMRAVLVVQDGP